MTRLYVIGSVHEEKGLASVEALALALKNLRPEVIFQEIPTTLTNEQILNGTNQTLEVKAAQLYAKVCPVALVPVDLPTPDDIFFRNNSFCQAT